MDDKIFCLKCKTKTNTVGIYNDMTLKKCMVVKGSCAQCGRKKCSFVVKKDTLIEKKK